MEMGIIYLIILQLGHFSDHTPTPTRMPLLCVLITLCTLFTLFCITHASLFVRLPHWTLSYLTSGTSVILVSPGPGTKAKLWGSLCKYLMR